MTHPQPHTMVGLGLAKNAAHRADPYWARIGREQLHASGTVTLRQDPNTRFWQAYDEAGKPITYSAGGRSYKVGAMTLFDAKHAVEVHVFGGQR